MRHRKLESPASNYMWIYVSQVEENRDELELCYIGEAKEKEAAGVMTAVSPEAWKRKNNLR